MKLFKTLFVVSLTATLLCGCAAAVVGGTATGVNAVHDRRTVGTYIDDEGIELKATKKNSLNWARIQLIEIILKCPQESRIKVILTPVLRFST